MAPISKTTSKMQKLPPKCKNITIKTWKNEIGRVFMQGKEDDTMRKMDLYIHKQ